MHTRSTLGLLVLVMIIAACRTSTPTEYGTRVAGNLETDQVATAKNIILLIGDGMGLAQVSTAFYYMDKQPSFVRFPVIGLHQNEPSDAKITDSAAGATAFSTGVKSYNAAIGVGPDTNALETILEMAAKQNVATGVLATSSITHATPASFYAHVAHRDSAEDIALQLVDAPVDFFAGGGRQYFANRTDGRDLVMALEGKGFVVNTSTMDAGKMDSNKKYGFLLADDGMPTMTDGRGDFLPKATSAAIDYLSQDPDGFFLMVEGSQIDWGGHANNAEYIIEEVKDFNDCIDIALDFAERDGNTLVLVTADHETGGLSLSAVQNFGQRNYGAINPTFSTGGHSASLIPVFAFGPGAERFGGIYQNSDIFQKMLDSWLVLQ